MFSELTTSLLWRKKKKSPWLYKIKKKELIDN